MENWDINEIRYLRLLFLLILTQVIHTKIGSRAGTNEENCRFSPISDEIKKLINDQNYLDKVLAEGAFKAEEIAGKKIKEMKKIIGF